MNWTKIINSLPLGSKISAYLENRSKRSQIVVKNAAGSLAIKLFSILVDFAKVPVLLTMLDASHYGLYITIASIVAWTHQFDFGLGTGLRYKLTECISNNNIARGKQLVSTAYFSLAAIMLVVLLIGGPIICFLDWNSILNCIFVSGRVLAFSVFLVLLVFVFQYVLELISVILQADQKSALASLFKPIANVITLIIVFIIRSFSHNSLTAACLAMALPIVLVLLSANVLFFRKQYRALAPSLNYFRVDCIKDIYSLGLKYFVSQLATLVVFSTASFLISHYISPEEAAVYNTAWTYFGVLVMFNNMVLIPLIAAVTDAYVKGEIGWIHNFMKKIAFYCILLSIASLFLLTVSPLAFHIWVGDKIVVPWPLAVSMTVYFICNIWASPYLNFLSGVGKMSASMVLSVFKIVLFFPTAIMLIKTFGTIGLVCAILVVNTIPNIILGQIQYKLIINNKAKGILNR